MAGGVWRRTAVCVRTASPVLSVNEVRLNNHITPLHHKYWCNVGWLYHQWCGSDVACCHDDGVMKFIVTMVLQYCNIKLPWWCGVYVCCFPGDVMLNYFVRMQQCWNVGYYGDVALMYVVMMNFVTLALKFIVTTMWCFAEILCNHGADVHEYLYMKNCVTTVISCGSLCYHGDVAL